MTQTPEWKPLSAGRENLCAWFERVNARQSFRETTWERVEELAKAA